MTTNQPKLKNHEHILLVEGQDDLHVVLNLYQYVEGADPNFWIEDKQGISNLLLDIPNQVRRRDLRVLGVIIDADKEQINKWTELRAKLNGITGIRAPQRLNKEGLIIKGAPDGVRRRPRIGVWMMPNNQSPGELEDFIDQMIPSDNPSRKLAKSYIDCILKEVPSRKDKGRLKQGKALRAEVHAWLATRERPRHLGAAIGAEYLDTDVEISVRFMNWLRQLFA